MTPDDLRQLFSQTLLGEYEDEAPWDAVSKLRSNGSRETFEIAARWLQESEPLKRARAAAILAQLRLPTEVLTTEPKWLFREEAFPLIADMLKREDDSMVLDSGIAALGHLYNSAAMLGLPEDPEEWEAEDYKRALDETVWAGERLSAYRRCQFPEKSGLWKLRIIVSARLGFTSLRA
jgi:hypothetical protein